MFDEMLSGYGHINSIMRDNLLNIPYCKDIYKTHISTVYSDDQLPQLGFH